MNTITWIPLIYKIAQFYVSKEKYAMANRLLSEAIEYTDDEVLYRNMCLTLAESYRAIKEWDSAIQSFLKFQAYGQIGTIYIHLGDYDRAIEYFEKLKIERGYWNYNYPHALYLAGNYFKALEILQQFYCEDKNFVWKKDLELTFICLDKAFDFCENREMIYYYLFDDKGSKLNKLSSDEFYFNTKHINNNEFLSKLFEFSKLIYLVISTYGNWETALIKLELLRQQKSRDKIHNSIRKLTSRYWTLKEVKEENINYSEDTAQKIFLDEDYAFQIIREKNLEELNKLPPENWYSYISNLFRRKQDIKGKDVFNYYNFLIPRYNTTKLFPDETIQFIDEKIKEYELKNRNSLGYYLHQFLENSNRFHEKSKEEFIKLFENFNEDLGRKIGIKLNTGFYKNEILVYKLIVEYFKGYDVIHQASPHWLSPQRFDVYIPQMKLAIEYQGEQHFFPIEFYGGEEGYHQNIERDKRKQELSKANNVQIEYVNYNDDIIKRVEEIVESFLPNQKI